MNKVILIGRIANNLELRVTPSGKYVCSFSLAVNRLQDKTDSISVTVWNKQAENLVNYQAKGSLIAVDGAINVDEYEKDGQKRYKTYVNAYSIEYLAKPAQPKTEQVEPKYTAPPAGFEETPEDDLPF